MERIILTTALCVLQAVLYAQAPAIHVQEEGKGQAIFFLPGFTSPGSVFAETAHHVKGKYKKYFVSYAGFNGLAPIPMPWYETIKQELISYIKNKRLSNLILIGHSMGGTLALDLAAELPAQVTKLVIIDALPCMREIMMPGVDAALLTYNSSYNQRMLAMPKDAFQQVASMMARSMTDSQQKIDTLVNWSIVADRETFVYGYTDLLKLDVREALKSVKAKALILAAPVPDADTVRSTLDRQYTHLNLKSIVIAPGGKHFIMFDQPEWLYEKVNNFLSLND
jgi:pimeloyl-ACP methyl ester carboxylesterase